MQVFAYLILDDEAWRDVDDFAEVVLQTRKPLFINYLRQVTNLSFTFLDMNANVHLISSRV